MNGIVILQSVNGNNINNNSSYKIIIIIIIIIIIKHLDIKFIVFSN